MEDRQVGQRERFRSDLLERRRWQRCELTHLRANGGEEARDKFRTQARKTEWRVSYERAQ